MCRLRSKFAELHSRRRRGEGMRFLFVILAAAALSAETPAADFKPYEQALAGYHFEEAAAFIDKLIEQRSPAAGTPRPDALLNALMGRLYLRAHNVDAAATYLDHAPLVDVPAALRVATAL